MILVEVYVPAIDQAYEFEIDEYVPLALVTEGLSALVASQVGRSWSKVAKPLLCCQDMGVVLPNQRSAYQCKIKPGSRLLLV